MSSCFTILGTNKIPNLLFLGCTKYSTMLPASFFILILNLNILSFAILKISVSELTSSSLIAIILSPLRIPASNAGELGATSRTEIPSSSLTYIY